jgi:hypothetical protein
LRRRGKDAMENYLKKPVPRFWDKKKAIQELNSFRI